MRNLRHLKAPFHLFYKHSTFQWIVYWALSKISRMFTTLPKSHLIDLIRGKKYTIEKFKKCNCLYGVIHNINTIIAHNCAQFVCFRLSFILLPLLTLQWLDLFSHGYCNSTFYKVFFYAYVLEVCLQSIFFNRQMKEQIF